jgi:transcriptional regulator of acetoin/glycerol metabolism
MDELLRRARSGAEALYRQVSSLGYVLLLTDQAGVTVDYMGDPASTDALRMAGLYLGSDWNEQNAGTCAVGTCIATKEALVVHQSDHYDATHIPLTCTAAPIFDSRGNLAAILDIASLSSPEAKASQYLALQMVKSFAHRIETASLLATSRRHWVIKLASFQEFAEVETEFVLTLDSSGKIVGFNHFARQLLAREAQVDWRLTDFLLGRSFAEFFDCEIDGLTRFVNSHAIDQNIVRLRTSGQPMSIQVIPPASLRVLPSHRPKLDLQLPAPLRDIAGEDSCLRQSLIKVARLLNTNMSVLIQGDTGTGKEFLAKAMHASSLRAKGPFIPVNCAALPESLIESELFGYESGSFTGALSKGRKGLIREAHGGTLFLDEIGDMPTASQTRLLRVLAEREVAPVGGSKPVSVDIRVIAATHCDLLERIRQGLFREDLYFRLNGAIIAMPPLRERTDLAWLIARLLERHRPADETRRTFSADAMAALMSYHWPGNVRELVNAITYACAIASHATIQVGDLPDQIVNRESAFTANATGIGIADTPCQSADAAALRDVLQRNRWNISAAARNLGIDRTTMHRRMRRLGVGLPPRMTDSPHL